MVLVPFLLSVAVFTRLAVIDLSLPAQATGVNEVFKPNDLKLEIVIRPDAIDVGDKIGGLIKHIPNTAAGYDVKDLATVVQYVKTKFPDKTEATILAQQNTPYDTLVQVMDAVRAGHALEGRKPVRSELFPNISVGDAP